MVIKTECQFLNKFQGGAGAQLERLKTINNFQGGAQLRARLVVVRFFLLRFKNQLFVCFRKVNLSFFCMSEFVYP